MKKQLLATTALAAAGAFALSAGAAAQDKMMKPMKPTLKVHGWVEQVVGVASTDLPEGDMRDYDGVDVKSDNEILFTVTTVLDNGMKITGRVELEGNTAGDQIDEQWLRVSGSFGEIRLGGMDNASRAMTFGHMGSHATGVGHHNLQFDVNNWTPRAAGSPSIVRHLGIADDAMSVAYFTPRVSGLQLGVSYTGDGTEQAIVTGADAAADRNANAARIATAVGANYVGKFGDSGVAVALGHSQNDADNQQTKQGGGVNVTMKGIKAAVGYSSDEKDDGAESTGWDFGVRYSFGPNAVSLGYTTVEAESNAGVETENSAGMLAYQRALGPGVNWSADVLWSESEGPSATQDGYAVTTGIKVRF